MNPVLGRSVGIKLCKVLGIDPEGVKEFTIRCSVD